MHRGHRQVRVALAGILLLWLAAASWPEAIDDVYISAAYATSLAETGELRWPGGEIAEGYSNLAWVLMLAAGARWGLDLPLLAKGAALGCGLALVAVAGAWLPADRRGTLILLGLALWSPLSWWSGIGMETTAFALLWVAGWPAVLGGAVWGLAPLWLAALTRPEGGALLLAGAWIVRSRPAAAIGAVAAWVAYQGWRLGTYGTLVSGPAAAKVGFSPVVLAQLPAEALTAAPLIGLAAVGTERDVRAWVPLAVSVAALVGIGGDWMGMGRILLPGVAATVVALGRLPGRTPRWPVAWVAALAGIGGLQPHFLQLPRIPRPPLAFWEVYGGGLEPPLPEDQRWIVEHLRDGSVLQSADIGVLAHLPGIRVVDAYGLVDPRFAKGRDDGWGWLEAWYRSDDRPDAIRTARWGPPWAPPDGPQEGLDPWLVQVEPVWRERYHPSASFRIEARGWVGWIRYDRDVDAVPSVDTVIGRWRALADRFPSQPFYGLALADALDAAGRGDEGARARARVCDRYPRRCGG